MADVFGGFARIMGFNKLVVVKRMRAEDAHDGPSSACSLDEARLAARLNHPNIVQTLEVASATAPTSSRWSTSKGSRS
jgi:serine/threonine-protein kinase